MKFWSIIVPALCLVPFSIWAISSGYPLLGIFGASLSLSLAILSINFIDDGLKGE